MKALVTGATGFVGSAVARLLLEKGFEVRVLVRPRANRINLSGLDLEIAEGDLTETSGLTHAVRGCDALFHIAADYRLWSPQPAQLYAVNVDGTVNIMRAAMEAGVNRMVYTSSVATLGLTGTSEPADEDTPVSFADMIGHYKKSKFLAEKRVRELIDRENLNCTIVNPSTPIGPRDVRPTPTGRMILETARGKMPAYSGGGLNFAHVDDVAEGHWLAFKKGAVGQRYILGGENISVRGVLCRVAAIAGSRPPKFRAPTALSMMAALAGQGWARLTGGGEPMATVEGVRLSNKLMYFSHAKAQHALGYNPRPVEQALAEAVTWFGKNGYLA